MSHPPSTDPRAFVLGSWVGPWRILELHDFGSFGAIYRVERAGHPEAGPFALKIALHPEDPRFQREAELLQRGVHPSIPRFEDTGRWTGPDGRVFPYVVMEWVQGRLLYEWARVHKPTSRELLHVLARLASALALVHADGGVHRDVKGDNILVTAGGRAVLLDWGGGTYAGAKALTDTLLPPGTSHYRAPEAVRWAWAHRMTRGESYQAGPADDVYALGVTAYRLCTGTYPPAHEEGSEPQRRLLAPRELATVSVGLERLLLGCLSKDARARPPAAALAISLSAAAAEEDATQPIIPTTAAMDTEQTSHPGPRRGFVVPLWLSMGAAAVMGGLLVLVSLEFLYPGPASPAVPERFANLAEHVNEPPAPEAPDGGVGEEALTSVVQPPRPGSPSSGLRLPMPKTPLPGQKKPPCDPEFERTALGACWIVLKKPPPCRNGGYELAGECVRASMNAPSQPTSEDPR
ncbi:MAG: protein kinase domain-containing protein [Hyalangium sp.]|uniref:serine/threonine-protein kinase n=1 Tax=Hyalangium sp. TaxID=2028555 RepID=UPI00389AF866